MSSKISKTPAKSSLHKYSKSSIPQKYLAQTPSIVKSHSSFKTFKIIPQQKTSLRPSLCPSEESTDKFKTPSRSPLLGQTSRQNLLINPDDEELLNTIRPQEPKAEIRSSPNDTEKNGSYKKSLLAKQCQESEQSLKAQREKYRKLESQYNELLNKNCRIEGFYMEIIQNLQRDLEGAQEIHEKNDEICEILDEVADIKAELGQILKRSQEVSKKIKKLVTINK